MTLHTFSIRSLAFGSFPPCRCPGSRCASRFSVEEASDQKRRRFYYEKVSKFKCFLCGRRAPEFVTCAITRFLRSIFETGQTALLIELHRIGCSAADVASIMLDFSAARRSASFYFTFRTSYMGDLPHLAFAIGHKSQRVARMAMVRCLRLFDEWYRNPMDKAAHYLTVILFWPGTQARMDIEAFIATGIMSSFLVRMAARCRFTYTSDRLVERLHAQNKHHLNNAPHAGPVHVAFFTSLAGIREVLDNTDDGAQLMAAYCLETKDIWRAVKINGLLHHKTIADYLLARNNRRREVHFRGKKTLIRVLYHVDRDTLYDDMPEPFDPPDGMFPLGGGGDLGGGDNGDNGDVPSHGGGGSGAGAGAERSGGGLDGGGPAGSSSHPSVSGSVVAAHVHVHAHAHAGGSSSSSSKDVPAMSESKTGKDHKSTAMARTVVVFYILVH